MGTLLHGTDIRRHKPSLTFSSASIQTRNGSLENATQTTSSLAPHHYSEASSVKLLQRRRWQSSAEVESRHTLEWWLLARRRRLIPIRTNPSHRSTYMLLLHMIASTTGQKHLGSTKLDIRRPRSPRTTRKSGTPSVCTCNH